MITRCEKCRGTKKIMGLGGMMKKCPTCRGIGSVEKKEEIKEKVEIPATALSTAGEVIPIKRKYKKRAKQTDFTDALNEYV